MTNPSALRNKTLGELLTELRERCGFSTAGAAAARNDGLFKSFLRDAYYTVWHELDSPLLKQQAIIPLQGGERLYDWHNDVQDTEIDPGAVFSIWVRQEGGSVAYQLTQGIREDERASNIDALPSAWDTLNGQLEIYPVPTTVSNDALVIYYQQVRTELVNSSDRPIVNDRLILQLALANAKAHFRHPDVEAVAANYKNMMRAERTKQHQGQRYVMGECAHPGREIRRAEDGTYKL